MKVSDFIDVGESARITAPAQALFLRKFRTPAPDFPHHVLAHLRDASGEGHLVCYIHFTDGGDILLGGGACTDERVLRRLSSAERDALRRAGGIYQYALEWSVRHFAPRFSAVFGYCGDKRAERVDLAAGFVPTAHRHLLVYWTRKLEAARQDELTARAMTHVPF